ncbi:unnamed protein product [Victoria cruziana]
MSGENAEASQRSCPNYAGRRPLPVSYLGSLNRFCFSKPFPVAGDPPQKSTEPRVLQLGDLVLSENPLFDALMESTDPRRS